jgi:hypothetical protein
MDQPWTEASVARALINPLEHAKSVVLNSISSTDAQRGYRHAVHDHDNFENDKFDSKIAAMVDVIQFVANRCHTTPLPTRCSLSMSLEGPEFRAKRSSQRTAVRGSKHYAYTPPRGVANRLADGRKNCK